MSARDLIGTVGEDWGGKYRIETDGECVRCGKPCLVRRDLRDNSVNADPRGVCGIDASVDIDVASQDYIAPPGQPSRVVAHWRCFEDSEPNYRATLRACERKHGWTKKPRK